MKYRATAATAALALLLSGCVQLEEPEPREPAVGSPDPEPTEEAPPVEADGEDDVVDEPVELPEDAEDEGDEQGGDFEGSGDLNGAGSSSTGFLIEGLVGEFEAEHSGVTVGYESVGSGNGIEMFLEGEVAFASSDWPLTDEQWEDSHQVCGPDGAFHIPAFIDPVSVVVNLEDIDTVNLDDEVLAAIFAGEITSWDDDAITDINPGTDLPDTDITPIYREDLSGTTESFTSYLEQTAPDVWEWEADAEWPSGAAGDGAQGTSGVYAAVEETEGAITYVASSQVAGGVLGVVAVEVDDRTYVGPGSSFAAEFVAALPLVEGQAPNDMQVELDYTATDSSETVYPLVSVSYFVFCNEYDDAETAGLVRAFAEYAVSEEGQEYAEDFAGSAPMTEEHRDQVMEALSSLS